MKDNSKFFDINRKAWALKTPYHLKSSFYNLRDFKKNPDSLKFIEKELLGNIKGKRILHLQCHFGLDSISMANLGAEVTAVDFSEPAIEEAKRISRELNIDVEFLCDNIFNLKHNFDRKFDLIYTSYGAINWLPELETWSYIISKNLRAKGIFLIVEFHPFISMLNDEFDDIEFSYFNDGPIKFTTHGTYTDFAAPLEYEEINWNHPISGIVNSLAGSGLKLLEFKEYPFSVYNCFPNMIEVEKDKFVFRKFRDKIPYLFSLTAEKN